MSHIKSTAERKTVCALALPPHPQMKLSLFLVLHLLILTGVHASKAGPTQQCVFDMAHPAPPAFTTQRAARSVSAKQEERKNKQAEFPTFYPLDGQYSFQATLRKMTIYIMQFFSVACLCALHYILQLLLLLLLYYATSVWTFEETMHFPRFPKEGYS